MFSRWQLGYGWLLAAIACATVCAGGCGKNRWQSQEPLFPGSASPAAVAAPGTEVPDVNISVPTVEVPAVSVTRSNATGGDAQLAELQRRVADMERNNEAIHQQLAAAAQEKQALKDQVALLQGKLGETVTQLRDTQVARDEADRRAQAMLASTAKPGASITANNSVRQSLQMVSLPGLDVRQDGDVIRIGIPSDQLFQPGSVEWVAGANTVLDQVATTLARAYPRQQVTIEAHTDSSIIGLPGGSQQLSASQALAVYQHLTARSHIPAKQLVTMAYGPNYPRVSNATEEGRKKNRRIELVIYPEQVR